MERLMVLWCITATAWERTSGGDEWRERRRMVEERLRVNGTELRRTRDVWWIGRCDATARVDGPWVRRWDGA